MNNHHNHDISPNWIPVLSAEVIFLGVVYTLSYLTFKYRIFEIIHLYIFHIYRYITKLLAWKNSRLNGIRTHDFSDNGTALLSYQANWETTKDCGTIFALRYPLDFPFIYQLIISRDEKIDDLSCLWCSKWWRDKNR